MLSFSRKHEAVRGNVPESQETTMVTNWTFRKACYHVFSLKICNSYLQSTEKLKRSYDEDTALSGV